MRIVTIEFEKKFKCPECGEVFIFKCLSGISALLEYDWWCLKFRTHVMDCTNQKVEAIFEKKS